MQPRKILKVDLYISEIINDIENNTVKSAETVSVDGTTGSVNEVRAKLQIGGTQGDEVIALRLIGDAASQLRGIFPDYLEATEETANNTLHDGEKDLFVIFSMPFRWNEATASTVVTASHRYIVNKSIERWQLMVNRTEYAASYKAEADTAIDSLRLALNARKRPQRCTHYDTSCECKDLYVYHTDRIDGQTGSNMLHENPQETN